MMEHFGEKDFRVLVESEKKAIQKEDYSVVAIPVDLLLSGIVERSEQLVDLMEQETDAGNWTLHLGELTALQAVYTATIQTAAKVKSDLDHHQERLLHMRLATFN